MAESSSTSAKSFNKSRPDQTQPVHRVSVRIHANDETGVGAAARKGKAEAGGGELFPGPAALRKPKQNVAELSRAKTFDKSRPDQTQPVDPRTQVGDETGSGCKGKAEAGNTARADKWKFPMVPQLQGIDERAEEFIAKFRQDMKLEREQSILDYEEMLKRSA